MNNCCRLDQEFIAGMRSRIKTLEEELAEAKRETAKRISATNTLSKMIAALNDEINSRSDADSKALSAIHAWLLSVKKLDPVVDGLDAAILLSARPH